MPFTLYTERVDPLDITRARAEAGLAVEKHRFGLPLPGESLAMEVFERDEKGYALGASLVAQALQDTVDPDTLPRPPLRLLLAIDPDLTPESSIPLWLDAILQAPDTLYLVLPRGPVRIGRYESRVPLETVSACLGESPELRGAGSLLRTEDPHMAFRLLVKPEFRNSALLADPSPMLVEAHAGGSPRAPLFSGFSRGGSVPFADFHQAVSQCRWLMTTHTLESVAVSLYTSDARYEEVHARLSGHAHRQVETIQEVPQPASMSFPSPYVVKRIEPEGARLQDAEHLTLWARGSLDELLQCRSLSHLVVDDSLWLDCASIAQLHWLRSLSMMGIKVQDLDFLCPLSHLEELRLSRLPFAGPAELRKPSHLRSLEVRQVVLPSLAFVRELTDLQSLYVDHLAEPRVTLSDLARHPSLHTLIVPALALENLDPLATLRLRRFETWTSRISNLEGLAGQKDLEKLLLQNSPIRDLSPLSGLESLQELWLMACPVKDLTPLAKCPSLRLLDLQNCSDVDWHGLVQLCGLETLYLQFSDLADAGPLNALQRLRTVDLRGTAIRSLQPLANLQALEELVVAETPVRDFEPLTRLPRLRRLVIDAEQVESASRVNLEARVT